jgi:DNA-binding response OmpR family regulator
MKTDFIVLIVEDEIPLAGAAADALLIEGVPSLQARTVAEAQAILTKQHIGAVWLDHYLLGGDTGIDLVKKMRADIVWNKIPIFVISNTASETQREEYLKMGVANYYIKSNYDISDIIKDIKYVRDNPGYSNSAS